MSNNPYATPESNVENNQSAEVENGNIFWGSGRLSVASFFGQYGLLTLLFWVLILILGFLTIGTSAALGGDPAAMFGSPVFLGGYALISLVTGWVSFCQMIKRFHDRNLNGWWVLTVLILIGFVVLLIPGKETPNRFGAWRQSRIWEKVIAGILLVAIVAGIVGLVFITL